MNAEWMTVSDSDNSADVWRRQQDYIERLFTGDRRDGRERRTEYRGEERRQQDDRRTRLHGTA